MQPGTPHFVITLSPSVALGQHFYATSTIRKTCWSFIHTCVLNGALTNTDHPKMEKLLQRLFASFVKDYYTQIGLPLNGAPFPVLCLIHNKLLNQPLPFLAQHTVSTLESLKD
jgi:hypothetical protein